MGPRCGPESARTGSVTGFKSRREANSFPGSSIWQSGRLLTDWLQVRVLPGEPHLGVPQPGRGPALGAGCWRFKSSHPDHLEDEQARRLVRLESGCTRKGEGFDSSVFRQPGRYRQGGELALKAGVRESAGVRVLYLPPFASVTRWKGSRFSSPVQGVRILTGVPHRSSCLYPGYPAPLWKDSL